jgi:hypothetical protein
VYPNNFHSGLSRTSRKRSSRLPRTRWRLRSPNPFLTSLPHYVLTSSSLTPFLATHPKIHP